jgi:divinyl chlorophyllide a 8-vinyl-reductase
MLLWDEAAQAYDAEATPSYGNETLEDFYARVLREGLVGQELGEQKLF